MAIFFNCQRYLFIKPVLNSKTPLSMKYQLTILLASLCLMAFTTSSNTLDEVIIHLKKGDANSIAVKFDQTVDLTFPGKSGSYEKATAGLLLKDFFNKNAVRGFDIVHQGNNPQAQFCIGVLTTRSGSYRTTVYIKQKGDRFLLQEIRFEPSH